MIDVDNESSVEEFAAEISPLDDDCDTNEDNACEFPRFHRLVHTARSEEGTEERKKEEEDYDDGSLYRMEALTSEVDALLSSSFKASDNFLPSPSEDNVEVTPIARKIAIKVKVRAKVRKEVQVVGEGRQVKTAKDPKKMLVEKKTKGVLLQAMITTA